MIIKAIYDNGHFDVFDTDHLTDASLYKGNSLTNLSFNLEDLGAKRLWLNLYYYEVADAYREQLGPYGLPVARRRDGWSFLLVDDDDIDRLLEVTADGKVVLFRQGADLVGGIAYNYASDVACEFNPQSVKTHDYLVRALGPDHEEDICRMMGYNPQTYAQVSEVQRRGAMQAKDELSATESRF